MHHVLTKVAWFSIVSCVLSGPLGALDKNLLWSVLNLFQVRKMISFLLSFRGLQNLLCCLLLNSFMVMQLHKRRLSISLTKSNITSKELFLRRESWKYYQDRGWNVVFNFVCNDVCFLGDSKAAGTAVVLVIRCWRRWRRRYLMCGHTVQGIKKAHLCLVYRRNTSDGDFGFSL